MLRLTVCGAATPPGCGADEWCDVGGRNLGALSAALGRAGLALAARDVGGRARAP